VRPVRPWLKAAEYASWVDASSLIEAARGEAARLRDDALREADAVRQAAMEAGREAARTELAAELAAMSLGSAAMLRRLEAAIAGAVHATLLDVIGDLSPDRLYESALRKAAKVVRGESFLVLRVPPAQEAAARKALDVLLDEGSLPNAVELVADPQLGDLACVMESDAGMVSAGLDVQLEAIGRAVSRELAGLAAAGPERSDE